MENHPSIVALKNIKSKLENRQMSVLVGAGFSKNVHDYFPSWSELLFDMAYFLHSKDAEKKFASQRKKATDKENFIKEQVTEFINQVGFLEVVSLFTKKKGFDEAIASYIEERVPSVTTIRKKKFLTGTYDGFDYTIPLDNNMLALHKSLINLPWNNIYTTNYDEMLEEANDIDDEKVITDAIKKTEKDITKLYNNQKAERKRKDGLIKKLRPFEILIKKYHKLNVDDYTIATTNFEREALGEDGYQKLSKLKLESDAVENNINRIENDIKRREREILQMTNALSHCVIPIIKSSELSVKRNKNIIKLHGTLRKTSYGFDNDIRTHYIISKDDYDSYPVKHEAFTQLMRISLLQESYCLVGFSGSDPNFLEWIKWVRDVLEAGSSEKGIKSSKIFIIDVSDYPVDKDRQLFYENYRIFHLSLKNPAVISFLEKETKNKLPVDNNPKDLLSIFFLYLKSNNASPVKVFIERFQAQGYQSAWDNVNTINPTKIDTALLIKEYAVISKIKNKQRISLNDTKSGFNRESLLNFPFSILQNEKASDQIKIMDLIFTAFYDLLLPIDSTWDDDDLVLIETFCKQDKQLTNKLKRFRLHDAVLRNDRVKFNNNSALEKKDKDIFIFENALYFAFNLNFSELKEVLDNWNPDEGPFILKKAGLLANVNLVKAEAYLQSHKIFFESESLQEQLYYYEMLHYLRFAVKFDRDKELSDIITQLEGLDFITISKRLTSIYESIKSKPEKIKPYGAERFTVTTEEILSRGLTAGGKSIQYIQILIESGLALNIGNSYLKVIEEWYSILMNVYEQFPFPVLFYTLSYGNEKAIRRIAQDYAYSDRLIFDLDHIMTVILDNYLSPDCPSRYKRSSLYFCSELFVAVTSDIWEDKFLEIINQPRFTEMALDSHRNEEYTFITEALVYIRKETTVYEIITFCFRNVQNSTVSDFIYFLNKNSFYSNLIFQNKQLDFLINKFIKDLRNDENSWFIIGNMHDKFTEAQINNIRHKIGKQDFSKITSQRLLKILLFFSENDRIVIDKIKSYILNSPELWKSGIQPDLKSMSMGYDFIQLDYINKNYPGFWSTDDLIEIYQKLIYEYDRILKWLERRPDNSFKSILEEMVKFLRDEEKTLNTEPDYYSRREKIEIHYKLSKGFKKIQEGILSEDKSIVVWALTELSDAIYNDRIDDEISISIQLLINKCIMKKEPGLEAGLAYLAAWFSNNETNRYILPYSENLTLLLKQYKPTELSGFNKPFVLKQLIAIAFALHNAAIDDADVKIWMDQKTLKRYYNYDNK